MNTERTCAPPRPTAPVERSHGAGRTPSAPADAFSALLGAAAPRADEAPRKPQPREDDAPRHDHAPTLETDDAPAAVAPVGEPPTPEIAAAPAEPTARLVTPEIFALQLASPLPPVVAPALAPVATEPAAAPVLPAFAPALPGAAAPQTAVPEVTEAVTAPAEPLGPALPAPAAAPAPALPALTGLTPASAVVADAALEPAVTTAQPTPAAVPAVPAESAVPAPSTSSPSSHGGSDPQPQDQPTAPAPAAPQVKPADAAAPAPAPATSAPIAAPVAPAAPMPQAATALERAVPLHRAVDTTAMLLHVAAERGVTHARLNLKPAELGGIEVRLQSSPQGVSAQLVADSPEAARMLSQASDDLRRQLSERDVTLLSLDVSTSSDQRRETSAGFGADGFGDPYRSGTNHARSSSLEPTDAAPVLAETSLVLPGGVLVDVLA